MSATQICENAWLLSLGNVNAVLLKEGQELTLVDAGFPDKVDVIVKAIKSLGFKPSDVKHLVLTHAHPDHIGSAADFLKLTKADTWMHIEDVSIAESGGPFRYMAPAPGLLQRILYKLVWKDGSRTAPFTIDQQVHDGDVLPVAGGLRVIHVPGHCAGQIALLWKDNRLLIVGDVGSNMLGVSDPVGFEDQAAGRRSQARLAGLDFDAAAFGHGSLIKQGASAKIRKAWGDAATRG